MTLGEKIKLSRNKKKISQLELGNLAQTHQKNISKYEQDLVIPSATTLKAIADVLDVTTDFLLGNEENTIKDTELLKQFKEIDNLPDDLKKSLLDVIKAFTRDYKNRQAYSM
ncbi:XRE family transcriptional regulator [Apibacter muscae]|uniref:helix-turn-helix domain-containing protein n=1 Tax=Apibacter muscae TaxID=2509004 RepID=UPI0011ACD5B1|nr:helix-turn-helix transcriptional regulator [Apibacter muscae]TWP25382.1 XRE family transcriptional regulator [Apibacter muscae]